MTNPYGIPSDVIETINEEEGKEGRLSEYLLCDWLEEGGFSELAEAWRIILEEGKTPERGIKTYFWRSADRVEGRDRYPSSLVFLPVPLNSVRNPKYSWYWCDSLTYFDSILSLAEAYVREDYAEGYRLKRSLLRIVRETEISIESLLSNFKRYRDEGHTRELILQILKKTGGRYLPLKYNSTGDVFV